MILRTTLATLALILCASASAQPSASTTLATSATSASTSPVTAASQQDLEKVREQLSKTREELAELKPIASVTNTVFYFVAGLSALLGFFGWRKFSDLDTLVGEQVKLQLPRDKREFAEFEELAKHAEELSTKLKTITADYESALSNLKYVDIYKEDFDIEGKLRLFIDESTRRRAMYVDNQEGDVAGSLYDPSWRNSCIALLSKLPQIIERRNLDGDLLFNAAQLCRRMEQQEIAQQVTKAAYAKSPSSANKALMLSSIVKAESGEKSEQAMAELMQMVTELPRHQPHIVIAEAWNAAVDQAAYQRLADSIEILVNRHESDSGVFVPSYAHAIRALCLLSESRPGSIGAAEGALAAAKTTLMHESVRASWVESTMSEISKCERALVKTRMLHNKLSQSESEEQSEATEPDSMKTLQLLAKMMQAQSGDLSGAA
jgi:hypothetical protein